jgi:hypothetical protein
MPLPRQKHDVTRSSSADRRTDGGRAVMKDLHATPRPRRGGEERGLNRLSNNVRILAPWVFIRNPHRIGSGCRSSNRRASARVAFTCGTRNKEEAAGRATEATRNSNCCG